MVAARIKLLRDQRGMTQTELAKRLGITRSSVNAWEMGISVPSTQYIVELARLFKVSTDYLLGVASSATVNVSGLTEKDIQLVCALVEHLREKGKHPQS
ncbi:MAG: helix-turn-helix transcriptional regulator [Oscillibacter sp.]|jgi:transcriptional regulator with XRE-family HTH domain|uniref:helix-turn-helix domain-containing protein n=1 Tax=uncultured Oscillibacter sp. TaxID=876091 RepID=UPI00216D8F3F|nr:helix-turn-helix transcriptional regulator [uncultured Oscillibacter sp.]MCI8802232.1 helix-turn-helix transcriptional regulator [Oscillibacter sp.]